MIPGAYGFGQGDGFQGPQAQSGNYQTDPRTGLFAPAPLGAPKRVNPYNQLNSMVQALMKGYLRKQQGGPGGLPVTSAAPPNALQAFAPLDKYRSYGVPFTGIQPNAEGPSGPTGY